MSLYFIPGDSSLGLPALFFPRKYKTKLIFKVFFTEMGIYFAMHVFTVWASSTTQCLSFNILLELPMEHLSGRPTVWFEASSHFLWETFYGMCSWLFFQLFGIVMDSRDVIFVMLSHRQAWGVFLYSLTIISKYPHILRCWQHSAMTH